MARYILLEVDDNDKADSLMRRMAALSNSGVKVVGLFAAPRTFCKCTRVKGRGWTRGQKLGWWVCSVCRRPGRQWGSSPQAVIGQAVNLLPELQTELGSPFSPQQD
jgi:hypothetical protein